MHVGVAWDYYDGNQDQVRQKNWQVLCFLNLQDIVM